MGIRLMGKGSSRIPTDDKKFADNFDRIFNNKKENADGSESNPKDISKIKKGELRFNRGGWALQFFFKKKTWPLRYHRHSCNRS